MLKNDKKEEKLLHVSDLAEPNNQDVLKTLNETKDKLRGIHHITHGIFSLSTSVRNWLALDEVKTSPRINEIVQIASPLLTVLQDVDRRLKSIEPKYNEMLASNDLTTVISSFNFLMFEYTSILELSQLEISPRISSLDEIVSTIIKEKK